MSEIAPQETELGEFGEMSFEDSMREAVARTNAEAGISLDSEPQEAAPAATPAPAPETSEAPDPVEHQATPEEGQAAEPPPQDQNDRSLARIMQKEQELLEKQGKYDAAQEQLNELRGRLDSFEMAQRNFEQDPIAMIRSLAPNLDLKRLAEGLWYENQGEKAPAKYLEQKAATRQNTELVDRLAKLEQGIAQRDQALQQQEAQRVQAQYQGALETFAQSVSAETHPLMSAMQAKNPQFVSGALFNIAQNHAVQTNGQVLSNDQLAEAFEKELSYYQLNAPVPQQAPPPKPKGTSLRNSSQQVQPDRSVEDELSDEYLHEQAMAAARAAAERQ